MHMRTLRLWPATPVHTCMACRTCRATDGSSRRHAGDTFSNPVPVSRKVPVTIHTHSLTCTHLEATGQGAWLTDNHVTHTHTQLGLMPAHARQRGAFAASPLVCARVCQREPCEEGPASKECQQDAQAAPAVVRAKPCMASGARTRGVAAGAVSGLSTAAAGVAHPSAVPLPPPTMPLAAPTR